MWESSTGFYLATPGGTVARIQASDVRHSAKGAIRSNDCVGADAHHYRDVKQVSGTEPRVPIRKERSGLHVVGVHRFYVVPHRPCEALQHTFADRPRAEGEVSMHQLLQYFGVGEEVSRPADRELEYLPARCLQRMFTSACINGYVGIKEDGRGHGSLRVGG